MKLNEWVNNYIKEVTHSHEYEDMSQMGEDENDPQEISVGNYQTKYFHVCPGASNLYKDIESKGVDMDMAERSARLQDALYFVEEHIQRDGYKPERDYVMVAKNIAKNIMKLAEMMGLEKEHDYIQGHVDTIEKVVKEKALEERVMELTEENVPTNPSKWSYYKSQAKQKFDVYPSAYANAWAAKQYKAAGGGWKTKKSEATPEEEDEFHRKLDKLVHKTFGKSSDEMNESNLKGQLAGDSVDSLIKSIGSRFVEKEIKNTTRDGKTYIKLKDEKFGSGVVKILKSRFGINAKVDYFGGKGKIGSTPSVSFFSDSIIDESVNENKVDKLRNAVQKINRKYQVKVSTHPVTKGEIEIILGRGDHPDHDYHLIQKLVSKLGIKQGEYSIFDESVNEGFKSEYEGNDGIVWKKGKTRGDVTNFTPYYKGHDIDKGGYNFKTEKELKDFIKDYILSNQLYNKYRNESVNEASVSDFEIGDFVHFKSKNKTGMVVSVKGNKVTINTPKGKITSDVKDVKVLHQDNVNEAYVVFYAKKKGDKPSQAAYRDKDMAVKFEKDLKKDGYITMMVNKKIKGVDESVNEGVEPQIKKIAYYTGTRPEAVEDFVSKHGLNITKLLKFVEKGKLPERMAIVSALAGRPGNPVQKKIIKQFSESINEDYYKSASDAADAARKYAEKKGFEIDEDDWQTQIALGGKHNRLRPGVGKTHSFSVGLTKNGKPQRKALNISLYGMDSGKFELTSYIN